MTIIRRASSCVHHIILLDKPAIKLERLDKLFTCSPSNRPAINMTGVIHKFLQTDEHDLLKHTPGSSETDSKSSPTTTLLQPASCHETGRL